MTQNYAVVWQVFLQRNSRGKQTVFRKLPKGLHISETVRSKSYPDLSKTQLHLLTG